MRRMDTSGTEFEHLARSFLGRASAAAEREMCDAFDRRVHASIDLARHGEELLGLENLCSNLNDYEIAVTDFERSALVRIADGWPLDEHYRHLISLLPPR